MAEQLGRHHVDYRRNYHPRSDEDSVMSDLINQIKDLWPEHYVFEIDRNTEIIVHFSTLHGYIGPIDFTVDHNIVVDQYRVECLVDTYEGTDFVAYKVYDR